MMKEAQDKESPEYQRLTWDALRKSINGLVNKVNISNIKHILPEFFQEVRLSIGASRASYTIGHELTGLAGFRILYCTIVVERLCSSRLLLEIPALFA